MHNSSNTTLSVIYIPINELKPDPRNPRKHSDKQIGQIARSINSFGFGSPILIDENNNVIAGHGRILACKKLGWVEVPAIRLVNLTDAQKQGLKVADNRLTENSAWDDQLLGEIFLELSAYDLDFDIEATGFSLDEIDLHIGGLAGQEGDDPADQLLDMPDGPVISQIGDLWLLGDHRLLCGDATKTEDIGRLMNGVRAAMTFTDSPYNCNYANTTKDKMRGTNRPILNDNLGDGFGAFLAATCANILFATDGAVYMCMSSTELATLQHAFVEAGGHFSTYVIWVKNTFTLGRSDYQRMYEPILYGWREGAQRYWCGARDQGDAWFFDKPAKNDLHPTQKPVELVMRAIRNSSERGTIVLDPFLGSGTTLIAAERTGRTCYGMELDPRYVDTIIRRWQHHTGDHAIHAGTGRRFDDIVADTVAGAEAAS